MSSAIPESWTTVPIGSVARVVGGGTPPSKDSRNFTTPGNGIPWVTPADLSGYRNQTISRGARDLSDVGFATCGATLLPKGAVLFSSRAPIGYVAVAANEISTNQGFKSFILPIEFDPRFVYYQLKHLKPEAEAIATGTTFKELSGAAAATLSLRIAPPREQTRIADQLDSLLTRIQACRDRLDVIPVLMKRFRQAVLRAAICGDLSKEGPLYGDSQTQVLRLGENSMKVPASWRIMALGEAIDPARPLCYGVVQPGAESEGGVPLIRVQDLEAGTVLTGRLRTVSAKVDQEYRRSRVTGGEVLVSVVGTIGRTAVVPAGLSANIARAIARIACRDGVSGNWISYWLSAEALQWHLLSSAKEVARKTLNLTDLARIPLALPSPEEQTIIADKVAELFGLADRIEVRLAATRVHARRIAPLTLAKAFRGDLVPQDSDDEPANTLLARITAQRAAGTSDSESGRPRKGRPPRAPKEAAAMTKSRQDEDVMGKPYLAQYLRGLGTPASAETLFRMAELSVADFYKQLAWEVAQGHVKDNQATLEPGHASG